MRIETRLPDHVSGSASLGDSSVRFESTSSGPLAGQVTYQFDQGSITYGVSDANNQFWSDGHGTALGVGDVALMHELTAALAVEMGTDPDRLGFAEMFLASTTNYLAEAPTSYPIPTRTKPLKSMNPSVLGNDGIRCVKKGTYRTASWSWSGYSTTQSVLVNKDGHCIGKCGDCGFGMGQSWTVDCLEHDSCIADAASKGLPVIGQSPYDAYCGNEWQEADDDFTLGWLWPYSCNG